MTYRKNVSKTIHDLGYPCKLALKEWIAKAFPDDLNCSKPREIGLYLSKTEKKNTVIELCAKENTAKEVAQKYNVDRASLYNWKHSMFGDKDVPPMDKTN